MNNLPEYSDNLDPDFQITSEEEVASLIFEKFEGFVEEEDCADLGREILLRVLLKFRPDLFNN